MVVAVLQIGLMHMRVGMFGPIRVGVRVFMFGVVVLMSGVRVRMRHVAMAVLMGMGPIMGVLGCHRLLLITRYRLCRLRAATTTFVSPRHPPPLTRRGKTPRRHPRPAPPGYSGLAPAPPYHGDVLGSPVRRARR